MKREKYNLISSLTKTSEKLIGKDRLAIVGQGDFIGANNVTRSAMNIKHQQQHLTIDNPEFAYLYDGKENIVGEYSSFYKKANKEYKVIDVIKKYDELLKGRCYVALYFLYSKEDDSYKLIERKEVENLTENFGFDYKNDYLDELEVDDIVPKDTVLYTSTSYDEHMNMRMGVNGRILYATHPAVQDDAIIISKSFAKRMISNQISSKTIPIKENTIFLNLYGTKDNYKGLPDIGETINDNILAATRSIRESRMFSDLRDSSLNIINEQSDQIYYGEGEIIDINVYCNNPNIPINSVNRQLMQYYHDARWFYTRVYKRCLKIKNSGSSKIDKEINRWMRRAMDYLDTKSVWIWNDNIFSNIMVEVLTRKKEEIKVGRKLTGRSGNKTVVSGIWEDEDMPYLTEDIVTDEYGVVHPVGDKIRVELITNPLAIINRTIPMALYESSITFITDKARKSMAKLDSITEQEDLMFDIIKILNPRQGKEIKSIYNKLSDKRKREFIKSSIEDGIYIRWEAFNQGFSLRDAVLNIHDKYKDIITPYNIFIPKPKWGRDIYIGKDCIGYQYMFLLKQSGERGFSVRAAGAINDESLPEKSHDNKTGKAPFSDTPIESVGVKV